MIASVGSSQECAVIFVPFFVATVTAEIRATRCFVLGGSTAVSGRAGPTVCVSVRCCLASEPCEISSLTDRLLADVGDGSAGLVW